MTSGTVKGMNRIEKDPSKGLNAALASTLRGELAASGMTFDQLATQTGISKRTLLRQLSTMERHIDISHAESIAAQFNLSLGEVLRMAEDRRARRPQPQDLETGST